MNGELARAKRGVVHLVRSLSRGRAVDILWWGPSAEVPTLYLEGRSESGATLRANHTFDHDALLRFSEQTDAELRGQMESVLSRFPSRPALRSRTVGAHHPVD